MRKTLASLLALICFGGYALANLLLVPPPSAAGYTGPGDLVASATVWYGLRAYTAAGAAGATPLANVVRASDSHTCDILAATTGGPGVTGNCSTGADDGTSLATFLTATTGKFITWYDQSGALNCGGAACNVTQGTDSKRPAVTLSCIGSFPCGTWLIAGSRGLITAGNLGVQAQPVTCYASASRTGSTTTQQFALAVGANINIQFTTSANTGAISAGTPLTATVADNSFHTILGVYNGNTNSVVAVNNSEATGAAGTGGITAAALGLGSNRTAGATFLSGTILEAGCWPSLVASGDRTALDANARAFWGY